MGPRDEESAPEAPAVCGETADETSPCRLLANHEGDHDDGRATWLQAVDNEPRLREPPAPEAPATEIERWKAKAAEMEDRMMEQWAEIKEAEGERDRTHLALDKIRKEKDQLAAENVRLQAERDDARTTLERGKDYYHQLHEQYHREMAATAEERDRVVRERDALTKELETLRQGTPSPLVAVPREGASCGQRADRSAIGGGDHPPHEGCLVVLVSDLEAAREQISRLKEDLRAAGERQRQLDQSCNRLATDANRLEALSDRREEELRELVAVGHQHGWNGVTNSKILASFLEQELNELARLRQLGEEAEASLRASSGP